MRTMQELIMDRIESYVGRYGRQCATANSYTNTGTIHIFSEYLTPLGKINYNFQSSTYTLDIEWKGRRIPSQKGREDYFDSYSRYDEPSPFWEMLPEVLKK